MDVCSHVFARCAELSYGLTFRYLRKSSESTRKPLENRQKRRYLYIYNNKQNNTWWLVDTEFPFSSGQVYISRPLRCARSER